MKFRTGAIASTALALVLVLAGCAGTGMEGMDHGDGSPDPAPSTDGSFTAADVAFAERMIAHHAQALEMADIVLAKEGLDERVAELALRIQAAQQPEIDLMTSWLDGWGIDGEPGGMEGMDHGDGLMSDDDMAALEAASGPEASSLFLEQMIEHHRGAIAMAERQLADGADPDALELAQRIVDDQSAEIAEMEGLLAQL